MTSFNLFALTSVSGRRILRIPLSNDVQAEITDTFRHQEAHFEATVQAHESPHFY